MPASPDRRADAYEQDREMAALRGPLARRGIELVEMDWTDPAVAAGRADLLLVRATWDYVEAPERFLAVLEDAAARTPVQNDPRLIRWNASKRYLAELAAAGLPVIPSVFGEPDEEMTLAQVRDRLGTTDIVLKPVVGGGGFGQRRTSGLDDGSEAVPPAAFAQPFVPEIATAGEISFVFIEDRFSHCVRKTAAPGDYLVQVVHGGTELPHHPSADEIDTATRFVRSLPIPALATRVDLVPTIGGLVLMELEVIEPHLFPNHGNGFAELFSDAVAALV